MFIESLMRLAEISDHYKTKGEFLVDEKFHKDTDELILAQSKFLITELEFKNANPGPYSFGFGDLEISIFSPEHTDEQEWAALVRKGTEQKNYRFNSLMGLIKVLVMAVNEEKDGSNGE